MNLAIFYFSATGNTEKVAKSIKEQFHHLKVNLDEFNITNYSERNNLQNFEKYKALIFGFPVHYWRAPRLIREWFTNLDGKGVKCSVFLHMEESMWERRIMI